MAGDERGSGHNEIAPGPIRLGRFIERVRMSMGLRQGELAALAGIKNPSYLSSIEAGQRQWPQSVMPRIATALGVHEAFFAYEAGIITQDPGELASAGSIDPNDPRFPVVERMRDVSDDDLPAVALVVEKLAARRR